jgi:hypothetical protein
MYFPPYYLMNNFHPIVGLGIWFAARQAGPQINIPIDI